MFSTLAPAQKPSPAILSNMEHHCFSLDIDDLNALIVHRGWERGMEWFVTNIPNHGFVLEYYPNDFIADASSVEGYFETLDLAVSFLPSLAAMETAKDQLNPAEEAAARLKYPSLFPQEAQANA